jgi:hypothetical protein
VDETYVKVLGKWHYLYRGIDLDGQVLDCLLSAARDLPAPEAFFERTIGSTGCVPEHVVTDKAAFYPSAIRGHAPDAKHTATGCYNRVISTNRCERNHGCLKSRLRPMRSLKSLACARRLLPALDALQLIGAILCGCHQIGAPCIGGRSYVRARQIATIVNQLGRTLLRQGYTGKTAGARTSAAGRHDNVGEPVHAWRRHQPAIPRVRHVRPSARRSDAGLPERRRLSPASEPSR